MFEHLTGLKINFHKSEVYCFGESVQKQDEYAKMFSCQRGQIPFKYLGIPIKDKRLCNSDWKYIEDRVEKKMSGWKGSLLSMGDRLILVETCLSNAPSYMMSLLRIPKGVKKKLDFFRARLLWQEDKGKKKYHLVNWDEICQPKDQGGLGVTDLDVKNISLLCKWLWKLENEEGDWQEVIRSKYVKKRFVSCL